jgi:hypothetical protein
MKIIYDISVFGEAFYFPKGRTRIFRVIENLAKAYAISSFSSGIKLGDYFFFSHFKQLIPS